MLVCIFSYNRGLFLENCVASIENCIPGARIAIFDDNSTDEETQAVLARLGMKHDVLQPGHSGHNRLGGLYGNMQSALEYSRDESLVCYLQDDTQVVRQLSEGDLAEIQALLDGDDRIGFVSPCFLRGRNKQRDAERVTFRADKRIYVRDRGKPRVGDSFSALHIMNPRKLIARGWSYAAKEPANDAQAKEMFGLMPYLKTPFAMWLPDVPTYRGKMKTLGLKLAEKRRQVGFYPFVTLSGDQVAGMEERPAARLPFAEDFLICRNGSPMQPWAYHPMQDYRWLQKLSNAELALRRWFGS